MAWQYISLAVNVEGYKQGCMDETDDDMLWNGIEEDRNISDCEEDKGTDFEDGD